MTSNELIKKGSNFLKKNKIKSHIIDAEILLSSISGESREKFLLKSNNPPSMIIEFFDGQTNINLINCFSNEGGNWKKSKLKYLENKIEVVFEEKFLPRRGRINCSMQDKDGWKWFGTQFTLN